MEKKKVFAIFDRKGRQGVHRIGRRKGNLWRGSRLFKKEREEKNPRSNRIEGCALLRRGSFRLRREMGEIPLFRGKGEGGEVGRLEYRGGGGISGSRGDFHGPKQNLPSSLRMEIEEKREFSAGRKGEREV